MEEDDHSLITSDIELASSPAPAQSSTPPPSEPNKNQEHASIILITTALFLVTVMVAFIIDPPGTHLPNSSIYITYMISIYLGFFIGVGLSGHLIHSPGSFTAKLMWIRAKLILIGLGCFSVAFVLRTCMSFPLHLLWWVWVLVPLAIAAISIVLVIAWKYK